MHAAMEKDDDVLTIATERFERRLSEETGKLRQDITDMRSELRGEISALREDMTRGLANVRVEIIKWSFAFWVAQVITFATLFLRSR